jgi:hypothetical protein
MPTPTPELRPHPLDLPQPPKMDVDTLDLLSYFDASWTTQLRQGSEFIA